MRLHTLSLLLILGVIATFTMLNWSVFVAPTDLSLGFTMVKMPLGMVMLGLLVFITILFVMFVIYLQTSALLEVRRHSRELQASRELADKAEVSRFTELRNVIETEMLKQANLIAESESTVLARVDQLGNELSSSIDEAGSTLAAYIGELEDHIEKTRTPPIGG